ncbi:hypothetical protein [Dactylosporangium sp. NPDC049140]|uniref:hypothetical protein n=1 Tax=Dactylosporangium sp. NPDC049140 TaxID=3155647 RepID=UPI0034042FD3
MKAGGPRRLRTGRVDAINNIASIDYRTLLARRLVRHYGRAVLFIPRGDTPRVRSATLAPWLEIVPVRRSSPHQGHTSMSSVVTRVRRSPAGG